MIYIKAPVGPQVSQSLGTKWMFEKSLSTTAENIHQLIRIDQLGQNVRGCHSNESRSMRVSVSAKHECWSVITLSLDVASLLNDQERTFTAKQALSHTHSSSIS